MKKKASVLAVLLLLSMFLAIPISTRAQPTALMYVEPAYYDGDTNPATPPTLEVDDTFTVTIMLKNFENLNTFQVGIGYMTDKLDVVSFLWGKEVSDGLWYQFGYTALDIMDFKGADFPAAGAISYSASSLTGGRSVTDMTGTAYKLMTITFKVTGLSDGDPATKDCPIHIGISIPGEYYESWNGIDIYSFILDPAINEMPLEFADGQIETKVPIPHPPEARFTWTPTLPYVDDMVTFDGSASKAGFDGVNVRPITEWRWDFDGDLIWDVVENDPVTTWVFTASGTYHVTLEVYAPGSLPTDTDQESRNVTVLERPLGPNIDLYADQWSIGPDQEGDAHAPQELVCLYAKVTYNDDPVANKLVAFQVKDANGADVIYRVDDTDEDGIAKICFRIPNTPAFGMWLAIATVDIAQETVDDTMPFKVGWIIEILSIQLTDSLGAPLSEIKKGQTMYFTITLQNIAKSSRTATLTVTVYDDRSQPIGSFAIVDEPIMPGPATILNFAILVPSYAFVGVGKAFANAFTAFPAAGGVPLCPEATTEFPIKKA